MLKLSSLLSVLLLPLLALTAPFTTTPCQNYIIISAHGTNEPQGPSMAFPSMIATTLSTVPGGLEYDVVYPASDNTQSLGAADIIRYITSGLVSCPAQKYALLGYSQGATAVAEALNHFNTTSSAGYQAIAAALVVGNPAHVPFQDADFDQEGGRRTEGYKGVLYDSVSRIGETWYASGKVRDICYVDDIVCVGINLGSLVNLGQNHGKYETTVSVQSQGSGFLIGLLG